MACTYPTEAAGACVSAQAGADGRARGDECDERLAQIEELAQAEAERERRGDDIQVGEQPGQPDAQDRAEGHLGMVQG